MLLKNYRDTRDILRLPLNRGSRTVAEYGSGSETQALPIDSQTAQRIEQSPQCSVKIIRK